MSDLSRRAFLYGTAVAAPALTFSTLPAEAAPHPDAALLAYGPRIQVAYTAWHTALDRHSDAEERYYGMKPEQPRRPAELAPPHEDSNTVGELRAYIRGELPGQREAQASRRQAEAAYKLADRIARKESGLVQAERAERLTGRIYQTAVDEALAIRPTTLEGLLFKATLPGVDDQDHWFVQAILADMHAMAKTGGARA